MQTLFGCRQCYVQSDSSQEDCAPENNEAELTESVGIGNQSRFITYPLPSTSTCSRTVQIDCVQSPTGPTERNDTEFTEYVRISEENENTTDPIPSTSTCFQAVRVDDGESPTEPTTRFSTATVGLQEVDGRGSRSFHDESNTREPPAMEPAESRAGCSRAVVDGDEQFVEDTNIFGNYTRMINFMRRRRRAMTKEDKRDSAERRELLRERVLIYRVKHDQRKVLINYDVYIEKYRALNRILSPWGVDVCVGYRCGRRNCLKVYRRKRDFLAHRKYFQFECRGCGYSIFRLDMVLNHVRHKCDTYATVAWAVKPGFGH